jgi:hypothetical protein
MKIPKWISVKKSLPKIVNDESDANDPGDYYWTSDNVLVMHKDGFVHTAYMARRKLGFKPVWLYLGEDDVADAHPSGPVRYWMPIPPLP